MNSEVRIDTLLSQARTRFLDLQESGGETGTAELVLSSLRKTRRWRAFGSGHTVPRGVFFLDVTAGGPRLFRNDREFPMDSTGLFGILNHAGVRLANGDRLIVDRRLVRTIARTKSA